MKNIKCVDCDHVNLVQFVTEKFRCDHCGEVNEGWSVDELYDLYRNEESRADQLTESNNQLADRLRERDNEIWRLCRLLDVNNINYEVE